MKTYIIAEDVIVENSLREYVKTYRIQKYDMVKGVYHKVKEPLPNRPLSYEEAWAWLRQIGE